MNEETVPITLDLPQNIYDDVILLANARSKTPGQIITEALDTMLRSSLHGPAYPDYPLGPPQWENKP